MPPPTWRCSATAASGRGDRLLGGAAGDVGSAATSLARLGGARVLAGARLEDAEWCRSAGAAEAHRAVERRRRGRIVLRVGPADA